MRLSESFIGLVVNKGAKNINCCVNCFTNISKKVFDLLMKNNVNIYQIKILELFLHT